MSAYVGSVIAVTAACAVLMMLTEGGKYERITSSASCIAIALCVILPLRGAAGYLENIGREIGEAACDDAAEEVVSECCDLLAARVKDALRENFTGIDVVTVMIETDDTDLQNIVVTKVTVTESGAPADEVSSFLEELLMCRNVTVTDAKGG